MVREESQSAAGSRSIQHRPHAAVSGHRVTHRSKQHSSAHMCTSIHRPRFGANHAHHTPQRCTPHHTTPQHDNPHHSMYNSPVHSSSSRYTAIASSYTSYSRTMWPHEPELRWCMICTSCRMSSSSSCDLMLAFLMIWAGRRGGALVSAPDEVVAVQHGARAYGDGL
jgi:hypothetical protein